MPAVDPSLQKSVERAKNIPKYSISPKMQQDIDANSAQLAAQQLAYQNAVNTNLRLEASTAGGGYIGQQDAVNALNDYGTEGEFKRKCTVLSAGLKAIYVPWDAAFTRGEWTGDIKKLKESIPVGIVYSSLLTSAGVDFWRAGQKKLPTWHIDIVSSAQNGAFGLAFADTF